MFWRPPVELIMVRVPNKQTARSDAVSSINSLLTRPRLSRFTKYVRDTVLERIPRTQIRKLMRYSIGTAAITDRLSEHSRYLS